MGGRHCCCCYHIFIINLPSKKKNIFIIQSNNIEFLNAHPPIPRIQDQVIESSIENKSNK